MKFPIGDSDFKKIVDEKLDFIDKSLFIKEVIDDARVILITRPRRFGKSFNLSMLHYFFSSNFGQTGDLFNNLNIAAHREVFTQHQGQYPVIFLTFKDCKQRSYAAAYRNVVELIQEVYDQFSSELLNSRKLTQRQKDGFNKILTGKANDVEIERSFYFLSQCLFDHYEREVCILVDEYDTPIQSGYLHGYYDEIVGLIRSLFGAALKDNKYLYKSVLTGILRVSKESLFSGLNNIIVYSVLHPKYGAYFGFTEKEVASLLNRADLSEKMDVIKSWYNGYKIGNSVLYNPWSIINCLVNGGALNPYWINTSDNALIGKLLSQSRVEFKERIETLLEGNSVDRYINESFVYSDLDKKHESAVWSLLLMAGYLKVVSKQETDLGVLCQLEIPNQEIRNLYKIMIVQMLSGDNDLDWYTQFLSHLLEGHVDLFEKDLINILEQTVSVYDVANEPEAFYHGLIIGLTASLHGRDGYEIKSNRESGYGRYDYLILSRDPEKLTILLEFKKVELPVRKKTAHATLLVLKKAAAQALQQMEEMAYFTEAQQRGHNNILKIGIAFSGKRFGIAHERL